MSLIEVAAVFGRGSRRAQFSAEELFAAFESIQGFQVLPVDLDVAREVAVMGDFLKDPSDRTIVATARVHGLRLVTSDQRIIASKLAPVVE
jgi:PIN domain nuclease of toxin-antitoxin system